MCTNHHGTGTDGATPMQQCVGMSICRSAPGYAKRASEPTLYSPVLLSLFLFSRACPIYTHVDLVEATAAVSTYRYGMCIVYKVPMRRHISIKVHSESRRHGNCVNESTKRSFTDLGLWRFQGRTEDDERRPHSSFIRFATARSYNV